MVSSLTRVQQWFPRPLRKPRHATSRTADQVRRALSSLLVVAFLSVFLSLILPANSLATLPSNIVRKRGDFAVRYVPYAGGYTPAEITWLSNFRTVITGEFLPPDQVATLHAAGCKVIFYEWTVAFLDPNTFVSAQDGVTYPGWISSASDWYRSIIARYPLQSGQEDWLLNTPNAQGIPQGFQTRGYYPRYYYDFTSAQLRQSRVSHLVSMLAAHNYDGLFFDTTHWISLEPGAQAVFQARHPMLTGETADQYYDRMSDLFDSATGQFLSLLKTTAPGITIFENQGYRDIRRNINAGTPLYNYYEPYATFDSTESYMTTLGTVYPDKETPVQIYVAGQGLQTVTESYVHPWYDPANPWDSVAFYIKVLITDPFATGGYSTPIYNINYADYRYQPTSDTAVVNGVTYPVYQQVLDREAIYYDLAAAWLLGESSYTKMLDNFTTPPSDDVYFADLGKAHSTGANYVYDPVASVGHELAWRLFDNGIAIVNDTGQDTTLTVDASVIPAGVTGLWDVFAAAPVPNFLTTHTVSIPASHYAATHRTGTSGRIFSFMRGAAKPTPSDFNGDGSPDLVLQSSSAQQVGVWFTNGLNVTGKAVVAANGSPIQLPLNWVVTGLGDFSGDGAPDLVLQNTSTGQVAFWFTNGTNVTAGVYGTSGGAPIAIPSGWKIVGIGDINADGKPDLVLANSNTGQIAVWFMNGTSVTSGAFALSGGAPMTIPSGWQIVGVGDFNGDGAPDLAVINSNTGQLAFWFMSGVSITSGVLVISGGGPAAVPAGWQIQGVGDFNGDGKADLVLQNAANGQLAFWYTNGATITGGAYLLYGGSPTVVPPTWTVCGPR